MTEQYYFFNSTATDRRRHQASDMADYWRSFLSTGLINWDGEPLLEVTTEGTNRNVSLSIGRAVMKGHLYLNKAVKNLPIDGPDPVLDRIDRLVLRYDDTIENRYIRSFIIKGEPSADPEPPELERTYLEGEPLVYEISLAQIRVVAGKSFIEQSDIYDERLDESVCGLASSLVSVPTDVFTKEWKEFVAEYNRWFAELQGSAFATVDDVRTSENNMKREIANLNLQIEANKRVKNGVTFGTNFADSFGMEMDMARTSSDEALEVGQTVITVREAEDFTVGTEVTIFDDVNLERINIADISGNKITLETALTKDYKEGVNVARSMTDINSYESYMHFGKWGDRKFIEFNEFPFSVSVNRIKKTNFTMYSDSFVGVHSVTGKVYRLNYDAEEQEELYEFMPFGSTNVPSWPNVPVSAGVYNIKSKGLLLIFGLVNDTTMKYILLNRRFEVVDEKEFEFSGKLYEEASTVDIYENIIFLGRHGSSGASNQRRALVILRVGNDNTFEVIENEEKQTDQRLDYLRSDIGFENDSDSSGFFRDIVYYQGEILTLGLYRYLRSRPEDREAINLAKLDKETFAFETGTIVENIQTDTRAIVDRRYYSSGFFEEDGDLRIIGTLRWHTNFGNVKSSMATILDVDTMEVDIENLGQLDFNFQNSLKIGRFEWIISSSNDLYHLYSDADGWKREILRTLENVPNNSSRTPGQIYYDMDKEQFDAFLILGEKLYGSGVFGIGAEITTNDIRFKVKPSKEVVTWLQHDEGLTVAEATFGNINLDLSTIEDETQAVGYTTIEQDEVRLTIERESVDDDVKATRILGGTS